MTSVILTPINIDNKNLLDDILPQLKFITQIEFSIKPINLDISEAYCIERGQYNSTKILKLISENLSEENVKVVGIVQYDLFIPVLTFVFGEAQLGGNYSLISLFRLYEEFYSGQSNYNLLKQRCIKEILHELGHNFGLIHCKDWECVMHSSSSIEEVDLKSDSYCYNCQEKIKDKLK